MSTSGQSVICMADGCAPDITAVPALKANDSVTVELQIVSDTICPWCFVGKRRIERAIAELASEGIAVTTHWLPFELNPRMPVAGMDRKEYRSAKFGSWENSQLLDAKVATEGAREGIAFRHDLMERTPNTRASHQLIWLAHEIGGPKTQNVIVEKLFSAYFCEGRDVGDRQVLTNIGAECLLPAECVASLFDENNGAVEVLRHEKRAIDLGVRGVPLVYAGDAVLFSGAQRTPLIIKALRERAQASAGVTGDMKLDKADVRTRE